MTQNADARTEARRMTSVRPGVAILVVSGLLACEDRIGVPTGSRTTQVPAASFTLADDVQFTVSDLSPIVGFPSGASAINNLGQIVGDARDPVALGAFVLTRGNGVVRLGPHVSDVDINDAGEVVGIG